MENTNIETGFSKAEELEGWTWKFLCYARSLESSVEFPCPHVCTGCRLHAIYIKLGILRIFANSHPGQIFGYQFFFSFSSLLFPVSHLSWSYLKSDIL